MASNSKRKTTSSSSSKEPDFADVIALCERSAGDLRTSKAGSASAANKDKLARILGELAAVLGPYQDQVSELVSAAPLYDSRTGVHANGYRSFVRIAVLAVDATARALRNVKETSASPSSLSDLSAWTLCLSKLSSINSVLLELHSLSAHTATLIAPIQEADSEVADKMAAMTLRVVEEDFECFYGKCCGFHISGDCRRVSRLLLVSMATFADAFSSPSVLSRVSRLASVAFGARYGLDDGRLARAVTRASNSLGVDFCKAFFGLPENGWLGRNFVAFRQDVAADYVIKIPPERMSVRNTQGAFFQVPIPSSHLGSNQPVQVRLIAPFRTPAMIGKCPCLTRAVEEVLYAYCWLRSHVHLLGWSGKRVVAVGDSAGANLVAGLALQCAQLSLPRPDHVVAFYPSLLCQMVPSPSRLLCLLDPFVMLPCLVRCLNAYMDPDYTKVAATRTFKQELTACQSASSDPLLSPLLAPSSLLSAFPSTSLYSTDIDPCLDETVAFSNRLVEAGVKVRFEVLSGLPHGFLSLNGMSRDCQSAVKLITEQLRDIIIS